MSYNNSYSEELITFVVETQRRGVWTSVRAGWGSRVLWNTVFWRAWGPGNNQYTTPVTTFTKIKNKKERVNKICMEKKEEREEVRTWSY